MAIYKGRIGFLNYLSSGALKDSDAIFWTEFKHILSQSRGILEPKNPPRPPSSVMVIVLVGNTNLSYFDPCNIEFWLATLLVKFLCGSTSWTLDPDIFLKKELYSLILWMRFNCLEASATFRRQLIFSQKYLAMKICENPENVFPGLWVPLHPNTMCWFSFPDL